MTYGGRFLLSVPKTQGSFSLDSIDLTSLNGVGLSFAFDKSPKFGYVFEAYLDAPGGKKIGEGRLAAGTKGVNGPGGFSTTMITINLQPVTDGKMHNLYIVSKPLNAAEEGTLVIAGIEFKAK